MQVGGRLVDGESGRIRELDGLRALAIISVFIFHLAPHLFARIPGLGVFFKISQQGWIGVDLFFVLSGFLITEGLLQTRHQPDYFRTFFIKRTLRIFPVYYFFLLAVALYFILFSCPARLNELCSVQPAFWLYMQNWIEATRLQINYSFMGHFWSLAIEEQFYLLWPIIVLIVPPVHLSKACIGIITAALMLRIAIFIGFDHSGPFLYFSTITRLDCLSFGALGAVMMQTGHIKTLGKIAIPLFSISATALAVIAMAGGYIWINWPMLTFGLTLTGAAGLGAIALMLTASKQSFFRSAMRTRPLGAIGRYSYAMYIFHLPIIFLTATILEFNNLRAFHAVLILAFVPAILTCIAAWLSWHIIEKRFLALRPRLIESLSKKSRVLGSPTEIVRS